MSFIPWEFLPRVVVNNSELHPMGILAKGGGEQ